jgi:hypothetical protein
MNKDWKQRHIKFMENSLEGGEPVMWKKKEYKFIQYFSGKGTETLAYLEDFNGKVKTAPAKELDLILELRFDCGEE